MVHGDRTAKTVFIFRGIPGSGKSTVAAILAKTLEAQICSADNHFYVDGVYTFDEKKIGYVHQMCMRDFARAISMGVTNIIVDNTNLRRKDFAWYRRQANKNGYSVTEVTIGRPTYPPHLEECARRNTHGVNLETIIKMSASFRP